MANHPHIKQEAKEFKWGILWWGLALLVHVGAVALVVFWAPLREWYVKKTNPEDQLAQLEGDRLREIVRQLKMIQTRRIREKVAEQGELLTEIEGYLDSRYTNYVASIRFEPEPRSALGSTGPALQKKLDRLDVFALYSLAQAIEKKAVATYRQMRIIELARAQNLSFEQAGEVTNVTIPEHPQINRDIMSADIDNATDGRLKQLQGEFYMVHAEIGAMIANINRMLDVARGVSGEDIGGIMVVTSGGSFEGHGRTDWGADIGPSLHPHELFPGARPSDFAADFRPSFGRKFMDDGRAAEWMVLDSWYIIGPFPNPNRAYMDKKFPPESVVDLDAEYVGKENIRLTWQWTQLEDGQIKVSPLLATNYAVWYAYTEVYSDRDQEKYFAFGSDDYSKVWINGESVWTSGKTPHHWIPDRGFAKIKLKRGHNPILVKLENAGGTTAFSVIVYTGDPG
jgi:hypothetical protein